MRRTRAIPAVAIGVITVIAAAHPAACALAPRPLYSISPIAAPPHIDGRVDDACWQTAARIGPFVLMGSAADPTQETHAWAAYDEGALYLAFECIEARMQDLRAARSARDSDVWHDDCVEVFLDPQRDRRHYFHLAVNANAAMYDERAALRPDEWDGEWHAAATRDSDRWTVEIAVPFATLGADPPGVLEAWGFNLAREERPHRELSQISPTVGSFHDPERFADLVFRGPGLLTASVVSAGAPSLGRHQAEVRLCNGGARPARVALWAETPGERQQRLAVDVASQTTRVVSVPYEVSAEGDLTLSLNAADAAGCSLLRSTPVSFHVEPNRQRLREIARMLHTLTQPARERGLAPELAKVQRDGERLLAYATDRQRWASGARSQWERLTALADRLDFRANRLRLSALTADPQAGYAIGVESPLRKLRPDRPYRGPVGRPAELRLCRNEYEPVQVVVLALDKPLHRVRTYATDLVGPGGARIRDHNVNLNLVGFVHTRKPAYQVERIGWYPDPLMDIEPFDVEADRFQPVWVTVYCPAAVPAGEYRGEIIIRPDNAPETRVPLIAHVWDFALPKETHLRTAFAFSEGGVAAWYGYDPVPTDVLLTWYDFLLRRRINPTNIYSSKPVPAAENMAFCASRGLNAFNIKCFGYPSAPEQRRAVVEEVRAYSELLRERGWFDLAYVYGFDEIRPANYPKLREMYGMIREAVPGLPRACTVVPNEELKGYVDIWVPLTAHYRHDIAEHYRAQGDEVWWYVCCAPHHPYANWFIDYPATDHRVLFWQNWKYGVNGFLYYALNRWHSNRLAQPPPGDLIPLDDPAARSAIAAGKRWPEVPWNTFTYSNFNGDGQLIYPGPNGNPLSSVRLECIRDGIEDYEYFHLLSQLTARLDGPERYHVIVKKAKALLSVEPLVVQSLTEYTDDPEMIQRARRALAEHIEIMRRAAEG